MVRFFRFQFFQSPRRVCAVILAFALLSGIFLGGISARFAEPVLFQLMGAAARQRVSITCLLPVVLLPVLLSAVAVFLGYTWLLIPVAFAKSFLFSYLCSGILLSSQDSGPLFAVLFLFVDFLSLPVLCWFWLRCFRGREDGLRSLLPTALLILGICLLNAQVISPFLAGLLS